MSVPPDDPLARDHAEAQRQALARRRGFAKSTEGVLAASMRAALQNRETMRTAGASEAEIAEAFERTVRSAWPQRREEPWHYDCDDCRDTGLIMLVCKPGQRCNGISTRTDSPREKPGKYRRLCALQADYEHEYGMPCFCKAGRRFRPQERTPETEIEAAARTASTKMTRFGR